jgi:hypothetical protein
MRVASCIRSRDVDDIAALYIAIGPNLERQITDRRRERLGIVSGPSVAAIRGVDPRRAKCASEGRVGEGRIGWIGFAEAVGVAVSRVLILWGDPV